MNMFTNVPVEAIFATNSGVCYVLSDKIALLNEDGVRTFPNLYQLPISCEWTSGFAEVDPTDKSKYISTVLSLEENFAAVDIDGIVTTKYRNVIAILPIDHKSLYTVTNIKGVVSLNLVDKSSSTTVLTFDIGTNYNRFIHSYMSKSYVSPEDRDRLIVWKNNVLSVLDSSNVRDMTEIFDITLDHNIVDAVEYNGVLHALLNTRRVVEVPYIPVP